MSTKEVYHSTSTGAHLSNVEEGDIDIDKTTRPTNGPTFVCNNHGVPPRTRIFIATTTCPSAAAISSPPSKKAQVIEVCPGESVDISVAADVNTTATLVLLTLATFASITDAVSVSSSIPKKYSRAYANMRILSAVHQSILTIEDNSDDNDLLDLKELHAKNKRRCHRQARKI